MEDFLENFLGGFLGGFFLEEFYGRNYLFTLELTGLSDFGFCQDFVSMPGQKFRSLEVRGKLIALKKALGIRNP